MKRLALAALAAATLIPLGSSASAAPAARDSDTARSLRATTRSDVWTQVSALKLAFPTYHPEGLVVTKDRYYLSSTEIIEPTVKYPVPVDGYDRTPGKGVGHVFVIDKQGKLLKDIVLGHDIVYHPGGIDLTGNDLWVPVAQYRPDSTAEIYRIDIRTLRVSKLFAVQDHIGGIVYDPTRGRFVGNNWGSRTFYEWSPSGRQLTTWPNPTNVLDFQDCQYLPAGKMACGGITSLPQTPAAGGSTASYELGGITLIDLHRRTIINEFPFQQWSAAGHVMTRNPVKLAVTGSTLTMWAAPDNGEETAGTQIYTWSTPRP
ncbi:DUF6454 family protein [Actinoplanes sp. N902-109]|uniref:DUF6454 family protein n=1 Tax=Actinoplanes sp. (strain N902-109) TaxID=649831 RepID=UPI00032942CE|nr:DUF6454 family protein [Actinoplanes sp. N902-109]AGL13567.1 hypothetical protein L083_0057 [Actinoplanes sp. N902-109]